MYLYELHITSMQVTTEYRQQFYTVLVWVVHNQHVCQNGVHTPVLHYLYGLYITSMQAGIEHTTVLHYLYGLYITSMQARIEYTQQFYK